MDGSCIVKEDTTALYSGLAIQDGQSASCITGGINRGFSVASKIHPFSNEVATDFAAEGTTLLQIMQGMDPLLIQYGRITINGDYIPREHWHLVKPKAGSMVNIAITPQGGGGGGGGGKNVFRAVLSIAVAAVAVVAAPVLAGALSGAVGFGAGFGGTLTVFGVSATSIIGAGLSAVGRLAINALIPPPSASALPAARRSATSSIGGVASDPTFSITGTSNQSNPFGAIPVILGQRRVFPPLAAQPVTEIVGDDQYLRMLFCVGYGPLDITDIKIGETDISQFDEVDVQIDDGSGAFSITNFTTNRLIQEENVNASVPVTDDPENGAIVRTTQGDVDQISFDLNFPQGLFRVNNSGTTEGLEDVIRVQTSPTGANTWTDAEWLTGQSDRFRVNGVMPVFGKTRSPTRFGGVIQPSGGKQTYDIRFWRPENTSIYFDEGEYPQKYNDLVTNNWPQSAVEHWRSTGRGEGRTWYAAFQSAAVPSPTALGQTSNTRLPNFNASTGAPWDSRAVFTKQIGALRSIELATNPVRLDTGYAFISVRIKASGQLSGAIDRLNCIATSKVQKTDGTSFSGTYTTTRNPAHLFAHVLRGAANARPVPDNKIDQVQIKAWADYCDTVAANDPGQGQFLADAVVDSGTSLAEILDLLASTGRARRIRTGGKIGVVIDQAQTTPIQMFTNRNSHNLKIIKIFTEENHAFRASFIDPSIGYKANEIIVYQDGFNNGNATRFDKIDFPTVTRKEQVHRQARYMMAQNTLRPEIFEVFTDIENIVCTVGDLVLMQHDVPRFGIIGARITALSTDGGGDVTAISIDDTATMEAAKNYSVRIRRADGTFLLSPINTVVGDQTTLTMTTPIAAVNAPAVGDLIVFGETDTETVELIITNIEPGSDFTAKVVMQAYNDAIFTADTETIGEFDTSATFVEDVEPPAITPIIAQNTVVENCEARYTFGVSWTPPGGVVVDTYEVYLSRNGGAFVLYDVTKETSLDMGEFKPNTDVNSNVSGANTVFRVKVLAVTARGQKRTLATATSADAVLEQTLPTDISGFTGAVNGNTIDLAWDVGVDTIASFFEIRHSSATSGATWDNSAFVKRVPCPINETTTTAISGTYLIKGGDNFGNYSLNASSVITTAPDIEGLNVVQSITEHPAFSGTFIGSIKSELDTVRLIGGNISEIDSFANVSLMTAIGGFDFSQTGTYGFAANPVDLGNVFVSQLSSLLTVAGFAPGTKIGDAASIAALTLISSGNASGHAAVIQVRTTEDDPNASPTWTDWSDLNAGSYLARGFEFRLLLTASPDGRVSPDVSEAAVTIDMPDRSASASNIVSNVGATAVSFVPAFAATPSIQITAEDMATGDYFELTGQSNTGFTVTFKNSSNTGISRTFDWTALGFGRLQ